MFYGAPFHFCPTFPPARIKSIRRRFYRGFLCLMLIYIPRVVKKVSSKSKVDKYVNHRSEKAVFPVQKRLGKVKSHYIFNPRHGSWPHGDRDQEYI